MYFLWKACHNYYAKADSAAKREALEKASEKIIPESRYKDKKREELLDWLKEMI